MTDCKICGLGSVADLLAATEVGARWGGFVFYPPSPRHISFAAAKTIAEAAAKAKPSIDRVALVVDADDRWLAEVCASIRPSMLQCHGNETPARLEEIKTLTGLPVMKAIAVATAEDVVAAAAYEGAADMLLFDSAPRAETPLPGGRGERFDWSLVAGYRGSKPWLLAGGLVPSNVARAIAISGAQAVDVSSGVETSPGKKDHLAMRRFVAAASMADTEREYA